MLMDKNLYLQKKKKKHLSGLTDEKFSTIHEWSVYYKELLFFPSKTESPTINCIKCILLYNVFTLLSHLWSTMYYAAIRQVQKVHGFK